MDDRRLSYLLATWREWHQHSDHGLGYPSHAAGIRWRPGTDSEALLESLDERMALAVDTAVDDLPPMERTAVHHTVLGPRVWRLREPIADVYVRACALLKVKLVAKGIE
jgi:hypothetical protein